MNKRIITYNERNEKHNHGISCGCGCCDESHNIEKNDSFLKKNFLVILRLFITICTLIVSLIIDNNLLSLILHLSCGLICGYDLIISCFKQIFNGSIFNENFLMLLASIIAFIIGENFEGALIIVLYRFGTLLESSAIFSSKKKLDEISKMQVNIIHLVSKTGICDIEPNCVEIGSIIQINKGERVPIDGILLCGKTELDTMAVSGESVYVSVKTGDEIISGSINVGESILLKTTRKFSDSVCQRIVKLVDEAQDKKAKAQRFITSFAKIYTPIVCALALSIAVFVPLFDNMNFSKWIYTALTFLVVSCPCALVISVPLAFFIGMGALARKGVLIKSSIVVENLSKIDTVVFDKTGTLTYGAFEIIKIIIYNKFDKDKVIDYACAIEKYSSHPIANVISRYRQISTTVIKACEMSGLGVKGEIAGDSVVVGNNRLMNDYKIAVLKGEHIFLSVYVAINGILAGEFLLSDKIKENAKVTIEQLNNIKIKNTGILSGDKKVIAENVANQVGINTVYYQLLPEDKTNKLLEIMNDNHNVAFVGDGINDSPSLASADVGFAMGGLGSDLAIKSADVVIVDDNLEKVPLTIKHSKKIRKIVKENIFYSIGVKLTIMCLSIFIKLPMGVAMFADIGVMLIAVLNSFRCNRIKY